MNPRAFVDLAQRFAGPAFAILAAVLGLLFGFGTQLDASSQPADKGYTVMDETTIVVPIAMGDPKCSVVVANAEESPTEVVIRYGSRPKVDAPFLCHDIAVRIEWPVTLKEPLGNRKVTLINETVGF
ncbi:hypothetical protein M5J20_00405 [Corynebacterium sp. TA-R-1]|uniref:DUF4307 domain-containing protein n=1 Tax=Corynebacterium stercoris TaxID=2943490 RepID=A0ABT1FYF1_9CORY|nr:hypothetical protein [Corynebacterium stercoris]MCP1386662.1 hypothetical protein [Corynebacterium stercoris]